MKDLLIIITTAILTGFLVFSICDQALRGKDEVTASCYKQAFKYQDGDIFCKNLLEDLNFPKK